MTAKELINMLESVKDKNMVAPKGFRNPHSWRGYYSELAFEPCDNVTIQAMLDCAKSAMGKIYSVYKGGEVIMDEYSEVHISSYGSEYDYVWEYMFYYMTNKLSEPV